jgi:regulatory protein
MMGANPRAKLYARALRWLSQREHSRGELRTRLLLAARARESVAPSAGRRRAPRAADAMPRGFDEPSGLGQCFDPVEASALGEDWPQTTPDFPDEATGAEAPQPTAEATAALVDAVLDQLQAQGYLSDQRFIESRLHARQAAWGARRIRHELRQHGLALDEQQQSQLQASERDRAQALWARRYGTVAADPAERARQMRFLAARGFSADAIRHAIAGVDDDELGAEPLDT